MRKKAATFSITILMACLIFSSAAAVEQDGQGKTAALIAKADTSLSDGDADKSIALLKEALAADPENPEIYDRLGYALLRKDRSDDAVTAFSSALRIKPSLRTSKTGLGLALLKKGDLKAAEEELMAALTLNPYPSMTHYALGLVYEKTGDYQKAAEQFKEGIRTYKSGKK